MKKRSCNFLCSWTIWNNFLRQWTIWISAAHSTLYILFLCFFLWTIHNRTHLPFGNPYPQEKVHWEITISLKTNRGYNCPPSKLLVNPFHPQYYALTKTSHLIIEHKPHIPNALPTTSKLQHKYNKSLIQSWFLNILFNFIYLLFSILYTAILLIHFFRYIFFYNAIVMCTICAIKC